MGRVVKSETGVRAIFVRRSRLSPDGSRFSFIRETPSLVLPFIKFGLSTPISHGWNLNGADEKSFRAELAKRTSTTLTTSYDGVVYIATRHVDGRIEYPTGN